MKLILTVAMCVTSLLLAAADANARILQGLDKKYNVPPENGFRVLSNTKGEFGNPANYEEVKFHSGRKYYAFFKDEKAYYPLTTSLRVSNGIGQLGQFADEDPQKVTRYAIYQYTIPEDANGNVWLFNGNFVLLADQNAEAEVQISVNGKKINSHTIKGMPRIPIQFEENLGSLKKGSVIELAIGPKNKQASNKGFRLTYGYEVLPAGENPKENLNLVLPAADQPIPPRDINGTTFGSYRWSTSQHNQELKKQEPQLILIGDSITAAWRWGKGECYSKSGTMGGAYHVAADKLKKYNALGLGLSGDWTNNVIWRIDHYEFSKTNPPKLVMVMIGTNNLGNGHSPDQVVAAQKVIVKRLREKLPDAKILLIGITPRGGTTTQNPLFAQIQEVNTETAKMVDNKHVYYLDLTDVLAPGGKIDVKVFFDQLHLTHYGLNLWADAMIPVLDKMLAQ